MLPFQEDARNDPSTSSSDEAMDCPICLDEMTEVDRLHPLQCRTNHCGYNFCRTCIESLITSSKDDYMEASDGNNHVKVYLHCPNCRSDLSKTIRDTVLLRRADAVLVLHSPQRQQQQQQDDPNEGNDDDNASVWAESDLHMKQALEEDEQVREAVEEARAREAEFFGHEYVPSDDSASHLTMSSSSLSSSSSTVSDDYVEEIGVEADLVRGVHESFRMPPPPVQENNRLVRKLLVDDTLLSGLGFFMSPEQQERVTDLLTSGEPSKLAQAAELMRQITETCYNRNGSTQDKNNNNDGPVSSKRSRRPSRRGSIYDLIEESKQAHKKANEEDAASSLYPTKRPSGPMSASARRWQHMQLELELQIQAEYLHSHPLPVRMPKCIELHLPQAAGGRHHRRAFALRFCNDTWDGTVRDAFCKLSIGFNNRVSKYETKHPGVSEILGGDGPVRVDVERPRVLVSSVQGDAGRQGVMKGDVVTHLNGVPFEGNADELLAEINKLPGKTVKLVLNASHPVAEALKLRSLFDCSD